MQAVILAGGIGSRLKPFTKIIPKPLLPIGESSVLEIQILALMRHGVRNIHVATNYMSEYVKAFLDEKKYDVRINFSKEEKSLGTCGPVLLIKDQLKEPFILMNGDILTTLNFSHVYEFACKLDSDLVVVTKELTTPFCFGNVIAENNYITHVEEKPDFKLEILSGIYILKPAVFEMIPPDRYYGIDSLIKDMIRKKKKVGRYLMKEYWLDIGQIDDYEEAQVAYEKHFSFLK